FADIPEEARPYGPDPRRSAGYVLDRARHELGFEPSALEDALAETLAGTASRARPTRATRTGPRSSPLPDATEAVARRLRRQAAYCLVDGSPLYASLLKAAADDVEAEGPVRQVLAGFENDTWSSALSLRLMGAVH